MSRKTILRGMIILLALVLSACACRRGKGSVSHTLKDISQDSRTADSYWSFASPESVGMDPDLLDQALTAIDAGQYDIHSLTIVKNGKIVMDAYGTDWRHDRSISPDDRHELHSVTKSVTSVLLGMAIEEGKIPGVTSRVMPWFENDGIGNLSPEKMGMTLEDLLTMRSGLLWNEGVDDNRYFTKDRSALAILGCPLTSKPGTLWNYSSGNSQILGEILRRATGMTPATYADEKLFGPLGITDWQWTAETGGTSYGGWGLFLRPRDMARFGWLCLNNGRWEGKQIVPAAWLETATKRHTATPWDSGGYGYHWWVPFMGGFAARGYQGQMIYIFPEKKLVVVFTARLDNDKATSILDRLMTRYILPSVN